MPLRTNYTSSPSSTLLVIFLPLYFFFFLFFIFHDSHGYAYEHRFSYAGRLIRARSRRHPMIYYISNKHEGGRRVVEYLEYPLFHISSFFFFILTNDTNFKFFFSNKRTIKLIQTILFNKLSRKKNVLSSSTKYLSL